MKEQLKRDLNKTYLILSSDSKKYEESYETEMIIKNAPQTLLPLHVLRVDGEIQYFYDVSAKQTLKDCAGRAKLSAKTLRILFETIDLAILEMKNYLLDMESVILDLEHIYTKEGKFYFCYCPWEKQEILTSFRKMLEDILGSLDYRDTEGVELAYHLYQSACRGDFHISKILNEHQAQTEETFEREEVVFEKEDVFWEDTPVETEKISETSGGKPKGILGMILKFFLKKQDTAQVKESDDLKGNEFLKERYVSCEDKEMGTQLLNTVDTSTVLLKNMPSGRWKLRPLVPGYDEFCITGETFLVGKKKDEVDGYIPRDTISRIHSRLFIRQERLFIADANSTNGTFVNDIALAPGKDVEIFTGDRILFADVGYECYNSL